MPKKAESKEESTLIRDVMEHGYSITVKLKSIVPVENDEHAFDIVVDAGGKELNDRCVLQSPDWKPKKGEEFLLERQVAGVRETHLFAFCLTTPVL